MALAEVELGTVAALVTILELVARSVEGVGNVTVGATASSTIDFQGDGVSHPVAGAGLGPSQDGVFPIGLVADVFLEVHAIISFLNHPLSAQKSGSEDSLQGRTYPGAITALSCRKVRRHDVERLARSSVVEGVKALER